MKSNVYLVNCDEMNIPEDANLDGGAQLFWQKLGMGLIEPIFKQHNSVFYKNFGELCNANVVSGDCVILLSSTLEAYKKKDADTRSIFKDIPSIGIVSIFIDESNKCTYSVSFKSANNMLPNSLSGTTDSVDQAIISLKEHINSGIEYSKHAVGDPHTPKPRVSGKEASFNKIFIGLIAATALCTSAYVYNSWKAPQTFTEYLGKNLAVVFVTSAVISATLAYSFFGAKKGDSVQQQDLPVI